MNLHERLKAEEDNVVDRRRISEESERELAEYIHHGDVELRSTSYSVFSQEMSSQTTSPTGR